MSYTILHDICFIRGADGRIMPLILSGDNNVWEYNPTTKRSSRDKTWTPLFGCIYAKEEDLISRIQEVAENIGENEAFKYKNKFVFGNQLVSFFSKRISRAQSIEEYTNQCVYPLRVVINDSQPCFVIEIVTNADFENFIEKIEDSFSKDKNSVHFSFPYGKARGKKVKRNNSDLVVIKKKNRYYWTEKKKWDTNVNLAAVMTYNEAKQETSKYCIYNARIVSASVKNCRQFVIRNLDETEDAQYVIGYSKRRVKIGVLDIAKRYSSYKSANNAMEAILQRSSPYSQLHLVVVELDEMGQPKIIL